jgi:CheY-like chemotaxis protein
VRSFAAQILSTAERAAHLTQSLLAFSRKQVITLRPVALHEIVQSVEKLLLHLAGEDVDLTTRLSPDDLTVQADGGQIEQVLMNLAVNARDAMPHGGRLVIEIRRVELDAAFRRAHGYGEPGSYGLIAVSDTGTGMDSQTARRIFEPFYTTKEVGKGTGLGLSIVYGIVKQHNGFINVYSEAGRGTTFKIYLPLAKVSVEAALPAESALPRGGTETILVAEDDEAVRSLMRAVLIEAGYRLIEAVDGEDAVAKFREHRGGIDLVILDVVMPKKNGREVFEAIRLLQPDITALFTSGYTSNIIHSRGVLDADAPLLMKPVSPNQLLKTVRDLLDRSA